MPGMLRKLTLVCMMAMLATGCKGKVDAENYPLDPDDARRAKRGKLTGEEGMVLFGGSGGMFGKKDGGGGRAISVNHHLWRASLEAVGFMPIASADPNGGVIITDWYEDPDTPGERFRVNILILDPELRADAVRANVFKQKRQPDGTWQDIKVDPKVARDLEDTILTKARALRVKKIHS